MYTNGCVLVTKNGVRIRLCVIKNVCVIITCFENRICIDRQADHSLHNHQTRTAHHETPFYCQKHTTIQFKHVEIRVFVMYN